MDKGIGSAGMLLGGAIIGWVAGRWTGHGCGGYGGYGYGYGAPCGPCGPGYPNGYYGGYDRPCHEDKQDEKIAFLMAESAANKVAICKDEKIAYLEDKVLKEDLEGKIYRATCMKPDGQVYLSPNHLANAYRGESRILDSHPTGYGERGRHHGSRFHDCLWD